MSAVLFFGVFNGELLLELVLVMMMENVDDGGLWVFEADSIWVRLGEADR